MTVDDGFCKYCGNKIQNTGRIRPRRSYCSRECYSKNKHIRDKNRKTYTRNTKKVRKFWEKRYPDADIHPAWPHRFNDKLRCDYCGIRWGENQVYPHPRCSNPHAHERIQFNRDGKPKIIK